MLQQFKNMNELTGYLETLEGRIKKLEEENGKLREASSSGGNVNGNLIAKYVAHYIPQTNLVNRNFLKRAFTVWGHFFVANLIIAMTVGIAYACLMMMFFGSLFGNLIQYSR
ncbi:MAG: hypothetical protein IT311_09040 [Anaerolineales bacterium]|nr:hypothetical protein [Anaerolineales bacterium]MCZ2123693.1 hypothetical protein [Anaerolineales bacterium]